MTAWLLTTNYPPVGGGVSRYNHGLVLASNESILVAGIDGFLQPPQGNGLIARLKQVYWAMVVSRKIPGKPTIISSQPHLGIGVWLSRRPFIQTIHGGEWEDYFLGGLLLNLFLGRAVSIVANSAATRDRWISKRHHEKVLVVRPGLSSVTPLSDRPKTFSHLCKGSRSVPLQVLSVSRFSLRKGHERLIRAVDIANREGFPIHLRIIGSGALESSLRFLAKDCPHTVIETGVQDRELLEAYDSADMFALLPREVPGGEVWEGFGIVYLEAAARGLPILASRTGGVPEAVSARGSKLLSEDCSASEVSAVIKELSRSPAELTSMSEANLVWAEQNSWASRVEEIERLLKSGSQF